MILSKVDLLMEICANPGWMPFHRVNSNIERWLEELGSAGWIAQRLDGYEATPKAMECHPNFYLDEEGALHGEHTIAPPPAERQLELPEQVIDLARAAVWCDYCKAMVQLVRRGPDALAPDALGCTGCGRSIGHANFWK